MDSSCVSFRAVRRTYIHTCKVRHTEDRFDRCNGDTNCRSFDNGVLYDAYSRLNRADNLNISEIVDIPRPFGTCDGSWLCYFKALQLGDVNKVVPIDKSSTVLTIIFAAVFLREPVSWLGWLCVVGIAVGTYLMIEKKARTGGAKSRAWLVYAALSAVFAALTSILGKIGIENVESNLGTTVRTAVVLLAAWGMVLVTKKGSQLKTIPKKELVFICLSGLATGGSWLCYYKALQDGLASVVVPIDKLSILVSIGFSALVFKERLSKKAAFGLVLIVGGTLMMLI